MHPLLLLTKVVVRIAAFILLHLHNYQNKIPFYELKNWWNDHVGTFQPTVAPNYSASMKAVLFLDEAFFYDQKSVKVIILQTGYTKAAVDLENTQHFTHLLFPTPAETNKAYFLGKRS